MSSFIIKAVQRIPITREVAWDFFSNPANLPLITPPTIGFNIISRHHGERMYPGQILEYTISPFFGVRLYWMTEITHVQPFDFFIDEERYGPYSMWHHQHHFKVINGGTEMTDIVHYKNPMGFVGRWFNPVLVRPKLRQIFKYRYERIVERFGVFEGDVMDVEM